MADRLYIFEFSDVYDITVCIKKAYPRSEQILHEESPHNTSTITTLLFSDRPQKKRQPKNQLLVSNKVTYATHTQCYYLHIRENQSNKLHINTEEHAYKIEFPGTNHRIVFYKKSCRRLTSLLLHRQHKTHLNK